VAKARLILFWFLSNEFFQWVLCFSFWVEIGRDLFIPFDVDCIHICWTLNI
jgi:hypothetical protein